MNNKKKKTYNALHVHFHFYVSNIDQKSRVFDCDNEHIVRLKRFNSKLCLKYILLTSP